MTIFLPPHLIGKTPEKIIGAGDRFAIVDDFVHRQIHGILPGIEDEEILALPREGESNTSVSAMN